MCLNMASYFALPFGTIRHASELSPRRLLADPGLDPGTLSYLNPVIMDLVYGVNLSLRLFLTILKYTVQPAFLSLKERPLQANVFQYSASICSRLLISLLYYFVPIASIRWRRRLNARQFTACLVVCKLKVPVTNRPLIRRPNGFALGMPLSNRSATCSLYVIRII